jgi:hypothetical protein
MDKKQSRALTALYAADVFLELHAARLPDVSANVMRERFRRTLAELIWHVQTQAGAPFLAQGLTRLKHAKCRALLRDHMVAIARIAKAERRTAPALAPLKMPRGKPGITKLLDRATAMAVIAEEHRDIFIARGCKPTFVEDLRDAITAIVETMTRRTQHWGDRSGATKGIDAVLQRCRDDLGILDGFVMSEAHGDPALLATWKSVKRAPRFPVRRRTREQETTPVEASDVKALTPIRDPRQLLPASVPDSGSLPPAGRDSIRIATNADDRARYLESNAS